MELEKLALAQLTAQNILCIQKKVLHPFLPPIEDQSEIGLQEGIESFECDHLTPRICESCKSCRDSTQFSQVCHGVHPNVVDLTTKTDQKARADAMHVLERRGWIVTRSTAPYSIQSGADP